MYGDGILIHKMKHGDENAVEEFVKKYYPDIYKYNYRHVKNIATAEDITQETFTNFFASFESYVHKGKIKNYLYVIAGNLCKNHYKSKQFESMEAMESEPEAIAEEISVEARITINQALNLLPAEQREVLLLRYFQDLKLREIAQILDITLSLVKYRLGKAKEKLQNLLNKEDFMN